MGRLITALPAVIYAGAATAVAVWSVAHTLRGTSQDTDDITNQPREENPQP